MNAQTKLIIGSIAILAFAAMGYTIFSPFKLVEAQEIKTVDRKEVPPELVHMMSDAEFSDVPQQVPPEQVTMLNGESPEIRRQIPSDALRPVTQ